MKKFINRAKDWSQKAVELKAALQQLPPKVAEVRETIAATAGQLQQLKTDVQSTVTDLKADNEQHISHAVQEINTSQETLLDAGFELDGLDLELSPVQKLLVRLNKLEDVSLSEIRSLISANHHRKTTQAILTSLLQAQEMADSVELAGLDYCELIVGIGPIPSVRICWRPIAASGPEVSVQPTATAPTPAPVPQPPAAAPQSVFAQSSFFEKRTPQPQPQPEVAAAPLPTPVPQPVRVTLPKREAAEITSASAPTETEQDPLARFKRMPNLTKSGA